MAKTRQGVTASRALAEVASAPPANVGRLPRPTLANPETENQRKMLKCSAAGRCGARGSRRAGGDGLPAAADQGEDFDLEHRPKAALPLLLLRLAGAARDDPYGGRDQQFENEW